MKKNSIIKFITLFCFLSLISMFVIYKGGYFNQKINYEMKLNDSVNNTIIKHDTIKENITRLSSSKSAIWEPKFDWTLISYSKKN